MFDCHLRTGTAPPCFRRKSTKKSTGWWFQRDEYSQYMENKNKTEIIGIESWLVGGFKHSAKYEFVNGDDEIPN